MTTDVILTGTGVPHARAGCAGAGTPVRYGDVARQFDAGRSSVMRLMEAGTVPHELTAVFLTHVHSDHLVGLPDLVMTRWTHRRIEQHGPLVVGHELDPLAGPRSHRCSGPSETGVAPVDLAAAHARAGASRAEAT